MAIAGATQETGDRRETGTAASVTAGPRAMDRARTTVGSRATPTGSRCVPETPGTGRAVTRVRSAMETAARSAMEIAARSGMVSVDSATRVRRGTTTVVRSATVSAGSIATRVRSVMAVVARRAMETVARRAMETVARRAMETAARRAMETAARRAMETAASATRVPSGMATVARSAMASASGAGISSDAMISARGTRARSATPRDRVAITSVAAMARARASSRCATMTSYRRTCPMTWRLKTSTSALARSSRP